MEDDKRVLWKKMKLLQYIDWDLKLELTLDPKRFMRLEDELAFIGKAWAKLRSWLLKSHGHSEFLCVLDKCKNWTVIYNAQSEENICCTCNYREVLKYSDYIKAENVSGSLLYPSVIQCIKPLKAQ
jgi:ribosomal protein S27E